ncbi:BMC domain-containing protein [Ruegeria sp. Ofav3-42]|uniref:BMC domain-containing protein n=1 Tax=Ruegeria sp. Ofav3-42 TaxID=2917759 RepID=UPI001EF4F1AC|nr:BMC domain-containing protein [Ruegeria sp. Ofav3-42]MCG7521945.1 BMC domain-containing protein [Ruegeria sp. Ofav3-42]
MSNSVGLLETRGHVAAVAALDAMAKAANVSLLQTKEVGAGLVSISVKGDVGAVKTAIEAGAEAANAIGEVVATHVIARPHAEVEALVGLT